MSTLFGETAWQPTKDDCYTPAWIFEHMAVEFDLDVAAPPGGVPWIPARRFLTVHDDGLSAEWSGRVWCNPPYSECAPWARRFLQHGDGIFLGPVSKARWPAPLMAAADLVWVPVDQFDWMRPGKLRPDPTWCLVFMAAFTEPCAAGLRRLQAKVGGALLVPEKAA